MNNIYFISDLHLGAKGKESSFEREQKLVKWLDTVKKEADAIYFLGDIFDFWYEWKRVIPKGFTRFLGKLCELTDEGLDIHFFTGNHDVWMFDYFEKEIGIKIHHKPIQVDLHGKRFYLGHGDALGAGDYLFKLLKKTFENKIAQWLFSRFHPNFAIGLAYGWSKSSRKNHYFGAKYTDIEAEVLVNYAKELLKKEHFDYFIFGHRHIPMIHPLNEKSCYVNTGDWLGSYSYVVFDGKTIRLEKMKTNE